MPGYALLDPAEPMMLPLEARDFGIYVGFLVTWLYIIAIGRARAKGMPPWQMLIALVSFVGIMGVDGVNAFLYDLRVVPHLYAPRLELRLATGLLCGMAFGGVMTPVVNFSLWQQNDARPVLENWKHFFAALALMGALFLMNYSEIGLFLYPLAIVTSASTIILIALINMVFILSLARKEGSAATWRAALNPFAVGVALAIIELAALSLLRYAVLGTTVLP